MLALSRRAVVFAAIVCPSFPAFAQPPATAHQPTQPRSYLGFDSNDYPGDALLPALRKQFSFTGYWLTNPPATHANSWVGKREILLRNGFGFLVLADGRLDSEILKSRKSGTPPATLGHQDAALAIAAARREGFPPRTILFLDQEEGGRMLPEQANYLLAWTEAVAASPYRPGVYASGHPVSDGRGPDGKPATITTIQDIRQQVAATHLHPIAFWTIQDACPPAPGCVVPAADPPSPDLSGTLDSTAWQYAQSPRTSFAQACGATYTRGNCFAPGIPQLPLDLTAARSPDPSHGR
ncbi:MAG TPA: glycoside hydrolase domain-containing protein [Acidobacteriaceae bacterium]|nr:glycoside hydrolase domain-containing protein [Acidobacteriaceae bacterium]